MANQRSFGRRINPQLQPAPARAEAIVQAKEIVEVERVVPPAAKIELPDEDFQQWKDTREFKIPWRQLSLMASLCFGIASFALPDSVNDSVQWLLYALMAASLYVGFSKRRKKPKP
jgi:hypothetical protein